jgi:hypothetical protein
MCEYCGNTGLCYVIFLWLGQKIFRLAKKGFLSLRKVDQNPKETSAASVEPCK